MKSFMRFRGLLVIAIWQTVPVGIDQYGRTRIGFGVGTGQLEYARLACDGSVIDADAAGYRNVAAEVEHWLVPGKLRLHGSGGYQWADSAASRGPFGTMLVAYDGGKLGIGVGLAQIHAAEWLSGADAARYVPSLETLPSFYLRVGDRDRVHFRTEMFPAGAHTPAEALRLLVGYNQFNADKTSGYLGLALIAASWDESGTLAATAELFKPIAPNIALGAHAFASPGYQNAQLGLTTQVRVTLR